MKGLNALTRKNLINIFNEPYSNNFQALIGSLFELSEKQVLTFSIISGAIIVKGNLDKALKESKACRYLEKTFNVSSSGKCKIVLQSPDEINQFLYNIKIINDLMSSSQSEDEKLGLAARIRNLITNQDSLSDLSHNFIPMNFNPILLQFDDVRIGISNNIFKKLTFISKFVQFLFEDANISTPVFYIKLKSEKPILKPTLKIFKELCGFRVLLSNDQNIGYLVPNAECIFPEAEISSEILSKITDLAKKMQDLDKLLKN